jgi:hypothetical protein
MQLSKRLGFLMATLLVGVLTLPVLGQVNGQNQGGGGQNNNDGGNNGGRGGRFGRGNFDPAQFRQRMMDNYKQQLGASDDEFAAIQPKIEAVMQVQRDIDSGRGRGMFGRGRRGGFGGGPPSTQPSPVRDALEDLQHTLDDQSATPDDIKAKLDVLRQARTKARQDLAVAQQDLKSILTQRQEAVMVLDGILD